LLAGLSYFQLENIILSRAHLILNLNILFPTGTFYVQPGNKMFRLAHLIFRLEIFYSSRIILFPDRNNLFPTGIKLAHARKSYSQAENLFRSAEIN